MRRRGRIEDQKRIIEIEEEEASPTTKVQNEDAFCWKTVSIGSDHSGNDKAAIVSDDDDDDSLLDPDDLLSMERPGSFSEYSHEKKNM
jgi:hypothetical protein